MKDERLTEKSGQDLKLQVIDRCGQMAGVAVSEIFEDAWFHGKNQVCQLVDENDHILVVLDSECTGHAGQTEPKDRKVSAISKLCKNGVVLYYYHSINDKHHHVCLALKKKLAWLPLTAST